MTTAQSLTVNLVGHEPVSAMELHVNHHFRANYTMVSRHLKEGHDAGILDRHWRGNQRFGCWMYFRKQS